MESHHVPDSSSLTSIVCRESVPRICTADSALVECVRVESFDVVKKLTRMQTLTIRGESLQAVPLDPHVVMWITIDTLVEDVTFCAELVNLELLATSGNNKYYLQPSLSLIF